MFFDSVYPTRPFDTVTKYTIHPYLIGGKIIQMVLGRTFLLYPRLTKPDSKSLAFYFLR